MKLYYLPGACSLTIHIALEWIGRPYEAEKVERDALKSQPYLSINPMGAVPSLTDGDLALTQNIAIIDYLAGQAPEAGVLGSNAKERVEAMRWLAFINSDLHRTFSLIFGPQRFLGGEAAQEELRASAAKAVCGHFAILNRRLEGRDYLAAAKPTAADAYLFVTLRWAKAKGLDLSGLDNLPKFVARMEANPGVQAALKAEGLA